VQVLQKVVDCIHGDWEHMASLDMVTIRVCRHQ